MAEAGPEGTIDNAACEDLFQEAWQYYQRYLSMFYLEDYAAVVQDAGHNLEIFDLVHDHADNDEDKWYFEQYYPHAIMMEARAGAMIALDDDDYKGALRRVREGAERIEAFVADWDGDVMEEDLPELSFPAGTGTKSWKRSARCRGVSNWSAI